MKKFIPLIVIITSVLLMLANFIFEEHYDQGFWFSILSSVLIIIAMVLTLREHQKHK
ncbi:hypothetical protein [Winogradskyella sediminis]|uniref:Uncharacterized protein n=1 Tax=Winogradskyella sediminis TaxID=1382466 RepID=A0A1H1WD81_9FLAO|nr:hypothetical protein [Winogradskyella sediminis]REG87995.1 hypothetical protein C8N41_102850 [Winogradskyella sediminis]SDS95338.1 hypothetical protein SAMN04489797_2846 [Winogradskyella sediminis]